MFKGLLQIEHKKELVNQQVSKPKTGGHIIHQKITIVPMMQMMVVVEEIIEVDAKSVRVTD